TVLLRNRQPSHAAEGEGGTAAHQGITIVLQNFEQRAARRLPSRGADLTQGKRGGFANPAVCVFQSTYEFWDGVNCKSACLTQRECGAATDAGIRVDQVVRPLSHRLAEKPTVLGMQDRWNQGQQQAGAS